MNFSWDDVLALRDSMLKESRFLRQGQALFNALYVLDPVTANMIRGTVDDCFYRNERCDTFEAKTKEIWAERNRES